MNPSVDGDQALDHHRALYLVLERLGRVLRIATRDPLQLDDAVLGLDALRRRPGPRSADRSADDATHHAPLDAALHSLVLFRQLGNVLGRLLLELRELLRLDELGRRRLGNDLRSLSRCLRLARRRRRRRRWRGRRRAEDDVDRGFGLGHVRPHVGEGDGETDRSPVEQQRDQGRGAAPRLGWCGGDVVEHESSAKRGRRLQSALRAVNARLARRI